MCIFRIVSERIAINSLYNIHWFVFVIETVFVYYKVGIEFLKTFLVNIIFKRLKELRDKRGKAVFLEADA